MRRVRSLVGILVGLGLLVAVTACAPAASSPTPGQSAAAQPAATTSGYRQVTPAELSAMLQHKDFLLVNVHVPYQGELEGTDLFLPYDQVETSAGKLPADKAAKIVVYCRSGAMSAIAAKTLVKLGYTNVTDLAGGMYAWKDAGYPLLDKARQ